jgi:hypothetical protein
MDCKKMLEKPVA